MKPFIVLFCLLLTCSIYAADEPVRIDVDGPINAVLAEFVVKAIKEAESAGAPCVILRLNTPGGFDIAMRKIIETVLTSKIPVVGHVSPSGARAASAGFFILVSTDVAAMSPGTNTGAAHPVLAIGGVYPLDEKKGVKTLTKKAASDAKAYLRGIAQKRGRNLDLAEKAITLSKSYTAQEALDGKLIDLIAADEDDLLEKLRNRKVTLFSGQEVVIPGGMGPIRRHEMTLRQKILLAISDPNLALLMGLAGLLLLYLEFSSPGMIAPGVIGALCLLLSLIGFSLLPVNFVGVLLIILAVGLFIAEIKVQGFGILGMGGIVAMMIGVLILVDAPQPELRITPWVASAVVIPFGVIFMFLVRLAIKSMRTRVYTGDQAMIGLTGVVYTPLNPEGKVYLRGEYWDAVSHHPIAEGRKVTVVKIENLKLTVEEEQPSKD